MTSWRRHFRCGRCSRVGSPSGPSGALPRRIAPRRFIELYTYQGDLVLDPFLGSGTTAVAAKFAGRHYVGCEIDPGYVEMARQRIEAAT